MEHISNSLQSASKNYESSQSQSQTTQTLNEISIYKGELTKEEMVKQAKRILNLFPKFPAPMLEELKQAFEDNNFNDARLIAAVNHVRDNYEGWDKLPNIANFIQYDKKIRVMDYKEAADYGMAYLEMVDLDLGEPRWVYKGDAKRYNLKKYEVKGYSWQKEINNAKNN